MSSIPHELATALARLVGDEHVLASAEQRGEYAFDAFPPAKMRQALGERHVLPDVVVRPGSVQEVQGIVRLANDRLTPIVPYGAGTGVMGAAVPVHGGTVVDMRRLDSVLEVSVNGLTAQVQAGALLQHVDRELNDKGLMLGHDPWSQPIATVGGAISTDGVGYLAARYGSMGEQVLGLEVVLPSGGLLQGNKVSTTAGAWLYPLFVGAEGTLGIVTAATLRVFPAPERRAVHAFAFDDFAAGFTAILAMGRRGVRPSMIDYSEEPLSQSDHATLYLAFEGFAAEAEALENLGLGVCLEHGGRDLGAEEAIRFWETRHSTAEGWEARNAQGRRFARAQGSWGGGQWFDYLHLALPPETVLDYKRRCEALLAEAGLQAREYAIWGRPDLFSVAIVGSSTEAADTARAREVSETLVRMAQDLGGSMEYCHGVGLKLRDYMPRELGAGMGALRAIKAALDPNNIMNPGKLGLPPPNV